MNRQSLQGSKQSRPSTVLLVCYSHSGQTQAVAEACLQPVGAAADCRVERLQITPAASLPFPWPLAGFLAMMAPSVAERPAPIVTPDLPSVAPELVILAYPVWFLSPAAPMTAFLQSAAAETLLRGTSVLTVATCRNMWRLADRRLQARLAALGASHLSHAVVCDRTPLMVSLLSTPLWLLTGRKGPYLGGLVPRAGLSESDIAAAARLGEIIVDWLARPPAGRGPLTTGALNDDRRAADHLALETIGRRVFEAYSRLEARVPAGLPLRRPGLVVVQLVMLAILIGLVLPLTLVVRALSPRHLPRPSPKRQAHRG